MDGNRNMGSFAPPPSLDRDPESTLRLLAKRLSCLNDLTPQETTPVNFAFGAICALIWARQHSYSTAPSLKGRASRAWKEARIEAERIAGGEKPPRDGAWLGGYFFNDAIIRIDVAFEHTVRYATNCHDERLFEELETAACGVHFPKKYLSSWKSIRREVNRLKHSNRKFIDGPTVSYKTAIHCLGDLISGIEWTLVSA